MVKQKHSESIKYIVKVLEKLLPEVQFTTEKNMEVDIIAELDDANIIKIVVRTVSPESQYTWIRQTKFDIYDEQLFMAVLYEKNLNEKIIYILPATEWQNIDGPFKTKDYDKLGQVSKPEYGINFSRLTMEKINHLRLSTMLPKLIKDNLNGYEFENIIKDYNDIKIRGIEHINKNDLENVKLTPKLMEEMLISKSEKIEATLRRFAEIDFKKYMETFRRFGEMAIIASEKVGPALIKFNEDFNVMIKGFEGLVVMIKDYKELCIILGYPPHLNVTLPELREIVKLYNELDGNLIKIKPLIDDFYIKKFDIVYIRNEFLQKWIKTGLLDTRIKIIEESLDCFEQELYFAGIPIIFSQLEGLIADTNGHIGYMSGIKLKSYVSRIFSNGGSFSYDDELLIFYGNILMDDFKHGMEIKSFLSRHAVIHGGDVEYGTRENYIKLILFFDSVHNKLIKNKIEEEKA